VSARLAIAGMTTAFTVAAAATAGYVHDEGWVLASYPDPAHGAALPTGCAGLTGKRYGIEPGRRYTQQECEHKTTLAMLDHYYATIGCLPSGLPTDTHAAFLRFALNTGPGGFCQSSTAKAARAGDLKTACERMNEKPNGKPQWVFVCKAGVCVQWPGLVNRRADERKQCERGLS